MLGMEPRHARHRHRQVSGGADAAVLVSGRGKPNALVAEPAGDLADRSALGEGFADPAACSRA
jgi:hypothetical protein